jgi:hypothetical protein
MITRKFSLSIIAIAALAPVVASASPEKLALNACAKAFASSITGGSSMPSFKLSYDHKVASDTFVSYYAHDFSFTMQARDSKTGAALARATCSADTRGEVLSFTSEPSTATTTLAAR